MPSSFKIDYSALQSGAFHTLTLIKNKFKMLPGTCTPLGAHSDLQVRPTICCLPADYLHHQEKICI